MKNFDRKKVLTLFALALLISPLLVANVYRPTIAQVPQPKILHGPPLQPIHMHSNITLHPIHMDHTRGILWPDIWPITEPNCTTDWQLIAPDVDPPFEEWHLSSWEDLGEPFGELSPNDQIDMTNIAGDVLWFHVDRMTLTLNLSGPTPFPSHEPAPTTKLLELKQPYCNPYDPYIVTDPWGTVWHEVWPNSSRWNIFTLMIWNDDPQNLNGVLDSTDAISFDQGITWWHVEDVATDLILRWKMMNPIGTYWHELYPEYCEWYNLTSWDSFPDPYCDRISPRDLIDMYKFSDQSTHWYFVDRVTITINVTDEQTRDWMMLELKTAFFEEMYHALKKPLGTFWHEVFPDYCTVFNLTFWDPMDPLWDNCNGVLDPCDYIVLKNMTSGLEDYYHITDMAYDIILNEYITDPVGTTWHELYPDCTANIYDVVAFSDNSDLWLSPCDNVTLALRPTGLGEEYHVDNVTLTLNVTILDITGTGGPPFTPGDRIYLENLESLKQWNDTWPRLYHPKIEPWDTNWTLVCPTDYFGEPYSIAFWDDNCNGVVDYCDYLWLDGDGHGLFVHVDEVAVDITVTLIEEEPPPPPEWYMKPPFPDYAPSGMPDFDQRQWGTYNWSYFGTWSHCGPAAVANSLVWLDSEFENGTTPPPTISDNYPLVQSYNLGGWDDHDPRNIQPLIEHLAWLMDTDGNRTGLPHLGTDPLDMQAGITHYLSWSGVNPLGDVDGDGNVTAADAAIVSALIGSTPGNLTWDLRADVWPETVTGPGTADNIININDLNLVTAHMNETGSFYEHTVFAPTWEIIVDEVMRCQDVVLLLVPWVDDPPAPPYRWDEGAHYVTVAGLNATTMEIVFSDPINDNAEAGGPGTVPFPHIHPGPEPPYTTHNDAKLVSHDMYQVIWDACPGGPLTIPNFPGGALPPLGPYPTWKMQIEAAIITSPYEVLAGDVAVIDVNTSKTGCTPMPTVGQGQPADVNATVENQGSTTETFNVTAYANAIAIGEQQVTLNPGENQTLTFVWDTTTFAKGDYTISAEAELAGDVDPADNTYIDGTVRVTTTGDINGDGTVDIFDAINLASAFGKRKGESGWNPNADLNDDNVVDIFDAILLAGNFGT